ncbi:hypothetical protein JHK87_004733 [Glycine soja]|uniref:Uncharacterized protein n=1 Tax=Glycine max TaxID=3847 RepID=A0A0R0KZD2_SOYBN|nr:hypothetical protein JHK87_004733 [Glycine soja]KAG5080845.1 hypothetical protein JHK86_004910 [Glycine max]
MTVKTQHLLREYKKETQTRYIILVTEGNRELHVGCLISIIEQAEERNAVWKMPTRCEICCEIMIAILIPPLGVCFRHGRIHHLLAPHNSRLYSWYNLCSLCYYLRRS